MEDKCPSKIKKEAHKSQPKTVPSSSGINKIITIALVILVLAGLVYILVKLLQRFHARHLERMVFYLKENKNLNGTIVVEP